MPSEDELEEIANAIEEKTGKTLEDKSLSGILAQIANQDYFNLGDANGGYPTEYAVVCQESRGTLLDCFFDAIGDLKGKFKVCSYYRDKDNVLTIRYCGPDQNPNYFTFSVSYSIETYRVLANIANQVGPGFALAPDANNYLLADSAHVCVDGHGIIITDDDEQIASCVKGDAITEGQIVNIAEEDMQYLIGVSLY